MTNGRQKGSRGERAVAGIVKEWWSSHESASLFMRTPLSGGWQHNTQAAAHFKACGDLMTTSPIFPFCVEVKWREQWSVNRFLDGQESTAWAWWTQAIVAAEKQASVPMLWLRRNRIPKTAKPFPWIVVIPRTFVTAHNLDAPDMNWTIKQLRHNGVGVSVEPAGYDYQRFIKMDAARMITEFKTKKAKGIV
jgi:hypothetical protein